VPLKTSSSLGRPLLLLALTPALASCGGGSTADPIAATTATTPAPAAAAPATTGTAAAPAPPRTTSTTAPRTVAERSRPPAAGAAEPAPAATTPGAPRRTSAPAPEPQGSLLDERAVLTLVERVSPAHYFQQGTVTGTYDGTMEIEARITSKGVIVTFTATLQGRTISGRGVAVAILDSTTWPSLRGTAAVTGGTGRFAGIHGRGLKVNGRAKPDASHAHVRLTGTVRY
jgi:hypothetical protein